MGRGSPPGQCLYKIFRRSHSSYPVILVLVGECIQKMPPCNVKGSISKENKKEGFGVFLPSAEPLRPDELVTVGPVWPRHCLSQQGARLDRKPGRFTPGTSVEDRVGIPMTRVYILNKNLVTEISEILRRIYPFQPSS